MDLDPADLPEPWAEFIDEESRLSFETELRREIGAGHALEGHRLRAVARRYDRDDVLVALGEDRWAIVHLTWARAEAGPQWPRTWLFDGTRQLEERLTQDAIDVG